MDQISDIDVAHYEGLVRKTASIYVNVVEEDYEDICQILRIKAWRALVSFDPAKSRTGRDRYVFSCIKNQCKDLVKKKKRGELFIEDVAPANSNTGNGVIRDAFEQRYMMLTQEEAFAMIEDETPFLPSTLSNGEREVIGLLVLDFDYGEISRICKISRKDVATVVRGIREKMADWRPGATDPPQPIAPASLAA
jgi:RNA polymerase sigma factor (sigma-70 family)